MAILEALEEFKDICLNKKQKNVSMHLFSGGCNGVLQGTTLLQLVQTAGARVLTNTGKVEQITLVFKSLQRFLVCTSTENI